MENLERLTKLKPVLSALAWSVLSNRLAVEDVTLAGDVKAGPVWETLSCDERQWLDMLIGANLSTEETRKASIELLVSELSEVLDECN